ncbi:MAG: hypothetical protein ACE5E3_03555 [Mariprofundus sp.]
MVGLLFAAACWALWYQSPQDVSQLAFERELIMDGEWWRLWTAHLTHHKQSQLIINTVGIAVMGLIAERFARFWQIGLSLLVAMPVMTGLLLMTVPELLLYRGAAGVAAMFWMLGVWFLLVEEKRFSLGYWLGFLFLLVFVAMLGMEGFALFTAPPGHFSGLKIAMLEQFYGILVGLALFNALHQIHMTKKGSNPNYRGPYEKPPERRG